MIRYDRQPMGEARLDANGNLIVQGVLTRTGVFRYTHSDGTVTRELRHPDDVFDQASLVSLIEVPVTDNHPFEPVTSDNVKKYMVGNLGDSVDNSDGRNIKGVLVLRDASAIKRVLGEGRRPKRELSCAYAAQVVEERGTYDGQEYDHRQTNIRYNHVALVDRGRMGNARLMLDSADAVMDTEANGKAPRADEANHREVLRIAARLLHLDMDSLAALPVHEVQRLVLAKAAPGLCLDDDPRFIAGAWDVWASALAAMPASPRKTKHQGDIMDSDTINLPYRRLLEMESATAHIQDEAEREAAQQEWLRMNRPLETRRRPSHQDAPVDPERMTPRQKFMDAQERASRGDFSGFEQ